LLFRDFILSCFRDKSIFAARDEFDRQQLEQSQKTNVLFATLLSISRRFFQRRYDP